MFSYTKSKMFTNIHDADLEKRQRKTFQCLDDPPEQSSKKSSWNTWKNFSKKNPDFMPQIPEINEDQVHQ